VLERLAKERLLSNRFDASIERGEPQLLKWLRPPIGHQAQRIEAHSRLPSRSTIVKNPAPHVTCGKNSGLAPGGDHQYTNFSRTIRPSFHSWIATWVVLMVPHSAWSMSTRQTTNALLPETT
jgi:hypothetical protein